MRTLLLSLLIILTTSVWASDSTSTLTWQQWKKSWPVYNPNDRLIDIQTNDLVQSVGVLDMRSDVSLIGLYTNHAQKPQAIKPAVSLTQLFQQKIANGTTGLPLLFVIKHFFIYEGNSTLYYTKRIEPGVGKYSLTTIHNAHSQSLSTTEMKCAIDIFVKSEDSYVTLVRVDTSFAYPKRLSSTTELMLNMAIGAISNKITESIRRGQYKNRKPVSMGAITDSYNRIFNIPILTAPILKKGVYFSWEQFKNNQLSDADFVIQQKGKEPAMLYLKEEAGRETLARDVYAVCDGSKTYRVQDGYVFEMFCDTHCIYWMGIEKKDVKNRSVPVLLPGPGVIVVGNESVGTKVKMLLTPFLMNLETGQAY